MSVAPSLNADLLRNKRSEAVPLCERQVVRSQVYTVPARNCHTTGVNDTPKSLKVSFMRNMEPQYHRPELRRGRLTVGHAVGGAVKN
jgi:hypothetical protein